MSLRSLYLPIIAAIIAGCSGNLDTTQVESVKPDENTLAEVNTTDAQEPLQRTHLRQVPESISKALQVEKVKYDEKRRVRAEEHTRWLKENLKKQNDRAQSREEAQAAIEKLRLELGRLEEKFRGYDFTFRPHLLDKMDVKFEPAQSLYSFDLPMDAGKLTLKIPKNWYMGKVVKGNPQGPYGTAFTPAGDCLLYTSPSPRDQRGSRMPSSA